MFHYLGNPKHLPTIKTLDSARTVLDMFLNLWPKLEMFDRVSTQLEEAAFGVITAHKGWNASDLAQLQAIRNHSVDMRNAAFIAQIIEWISK